MIFDLYAVVSNFSVKVAHSLIGSFFWCFLLLRHLRLSWLSSEESESSLKDGSDKSSFQWLRRFFFFVLFFFFALESDDNVSYESYDEGSGFGFTYGLYVSSCFELSVDRVSWLLYSRVTISISSVHWIFSGLGVSCSKTFLVSISEFLIWLR